MTDKEILNEYCEKECKDFLHCGYSNKKHCPCHKGIKYGLAEGRMEGYEQGKNNERELQCGKKNYERDIERLEKEKCELLGIIQGKDEVIAELKEQNEKMRCCGNCKNVHYEWGEKVIEGICCECRNYNKWEMKK